MIRARVARRLDGITAMLDPYNPEGSTRDVRFTTSKKTRWETAGNRCHVNWAVCDSTWEAEFCRVAETHPRVLAYVKNHHLGLWRFRTDTAPRSATSTRSSRGAARTCPARPS